MAYQRFKDLAATVGSYQDRATGQQKNRYENVGAILRNEQGEMMVLLKASFNPAGIAREPGRESIILSVFDLRDANGQPMQTASRAPARAPATAPAGEIDDDIPF